MAQFEGYLRFHNPETLLGSDPLPSFALDLTGTRPTDGMGWAEVYCAEADFGVAQKEAKEDLAARAESYAEAGEDFDEEAELDEIHFVRILDDGRLLSWGPFSEAVDYARLDDEPEFELSVAQMFEAHGQEMEFEGEDEGPQP